MFLKRAFYDPLFKCASKSTLFFTLFPVVIAGLSGTLVIDNAPFRRRKIRIKIVLAHTVESIPYPIHTKCGTALQHIIQHSISDFGFFCSDAVLFTGRQIIVCDNRRFCYHHFIANILQPQNARLHQQWQNAPSFPPMRACHTGKAAPMLPPHQMPYQAANVLPLS